MLTGEVPAGMSMTGRLAEKIVMLGLGLSTALAAQEATDSTPKTSGSVFQAEVSVGYVLVPVVVRSRTGAAARLSAEQFSLTVDGLPVAIESFESGAQAPIGVLFLQDLSGSMSIGPKLEQSRQLIDCVLGLERNGDEFAVASFSNQKLFVEVPFPGTLEAIREVTNSWRGYGRTALHDAVAWLPDLVHSRASPRRAVVLITDGVDNASLVAPAEARDQMRHAEVPVHVVGLESGNIYSLRRDGGKVHRLADTLNLIGWATGGGYYGIDNSDDVTSACHAIVDQLRHQYVLGFSTAAEPAADRHRIEVTIRGKKKLQIQHRHSYEGTPPRTIDSSPRPR